MSPGWPVHLLHQGSPHQSDGGTSVQAVSVVDCFPHELLGDLLRRFGDSVALQLNLVERFHLEFEGDVVGGMLLNEPVGPITPDNA